MDIIHDTAGREEPIVINRDDFAKKIEIAIKYITKNDLFFLTRRQRKELFIAIDKMMEGSWTPDIKFDENQKLTKREKLDIVSREKAKGYLVYSEKFDNLRFKVRVKFINKTHVGHNVYYDTQKAKFSINIRIHFSDIEAIFTKTAGQICAPVNFSMSPQEANFQFLVNFKPPITN